MDEMAVRELVRELVEEYLPQQRRARMESYRKPPVAPPGDAEDGPEQLPPECANGTCEHLEHARDDELEGL